MCNVTEEDVEGEKKIEENYYRKKVSTKQQQSIITSRTTMGMFINCKEIRNGVRKNIYNDELKKRAEMMYWHWNTKQPNFADTNDEVKGSMEILKVGIKNKGKIVRPNICSTHTLDNEEWHSLVFQMTNENGEVLEDKNALCALSISVFGYQVGTEVYWFRNKANRDKMMKYFEKLQDKAFGKKIIDTTSQC